MCKAFEAGAAGVLTSREYDEMRLPNLRAVGRAIGDLPSLNLWRLKGRLLDLRKLTRGLAARV